MSKKYTFREITEKEDLEQLFKLRYQVYADCELAPLIKLNDHQLDMDIFDLHSLFYGVYHKERLIAGLRVAIEKSENFNPIVYAIGNRNNLFNGAYNSQEKLTNSKTPDLPFLSYPKVPEGVKQFYEVQRKSNKIYNIGRCVIDPTFRGLKTMLLLTEGIATALANRSGEQIGLAISDVSLSHSKFYNRYGYSAIDNAPTYIVNEITIVCLTMSLSANLSLSSIPEYMRPKFTTMQEEYSTTNMLQREI